MIDDPTPYLKALDALRTDVFTLALAEDTPFRVTSIALPEATPDGMCAAKGHWNAFCPQPATHLVGIRHREPKAADCPAPDGADTPLCAEHVAFVYSDHSDFRCNCCGACCLFTEPVALR